MPHDASDGFRRDGAPDQAASRRARCHVLLKRAILTLAAVPDPDARFRSSFRSCLPRTQFTAEEMAAQIDHAEKLRKQLGETPPARFQPTPHDLDRYLDVLTWLSWLTGQPKGEREVKLIVARAFGTEYWKLTHRFGKSEPTLKRWHNAAIAAIADRFRRDVASIWARSPDLAQETGLGPLVPGPL